MDEAKLVVQARADPVAFARLYDHTLPAVYRYAFGLTGDHARAEDASAETYRRALAALDRWEDRGQPFTAWLLTICRNVIRDGARRSRREVALGDWDGVVDAWPGEDAAREETGRQVRKLVARLTPSQQRVVVLRYGHDLTCAEVATKLDTTEAAVRQLSHRAIVRLRQLMKEESNERPW